MSEDSTTLIHPATQAILNRIAAIEAYLLNGDYVKAFEVMAYTIYSMAPSDQDIKYTYANGEQKALSEVINNEDKALRFESSRAAYAQRVRERRYLYPKWLQLIENQLHNKGYLDGSKFMAFRDLTGGKPRR